MSSDFFVTYLPDRSSLGGGAAPPRLNDSRYSSHCVGIRGETVEFSNHFLDFLARGEAFLQDSVDDVFHRNGVEELNLLLSPDRLHDRYANVFETAASQEKW
jgi:hypothetical protein